MGKSRRNQQIGVVLFACLILSVSLDIFGQEIEFRFNPPHGITYTETLKTTKVKEVASLGKQTDTGEMKSRISIKKTLNGYTVVVTPITMTMMRNGQVISNPMIPLLLDTVVTYELDSGGHLLAIHGYETLLERIQKSFPPELAKSFSTAFNKNTLIKKETAEWKGRIGNFIGRKAKIGDVWTTTEEFELPTGGIVGYYSATKVMGEVKCGKHDCLQIQFFYNTNADALKEYVGEMLNTVTKAIDASKVIPIEVSGVEVMGKGERLIDPTTMLIYQEMIGRTIKMFTDVPGQGRVLTTVQEKREYSFDYPEDN